MVASNELTTADGRYEEQRRRAAEFQVRLEAEAADHVAEVIDLRTHEQVA